MMKFVLAAAAAQFLVIAAVSAFSRAKFPKFGLRGTEKLLLLSATILFASTIALIDFRGLWKSSSPLATSALVKDEPERASCARIEIGMTRNEVVSRLGKPDETRSDEETRGPGAAVLVYAGSRCAVHVFNGRVEFVE